MLIDFEELDYRETPIGELSLRRRTQGPLGVEVFEVKLGDEFLMSSLFTEGEIALADLGLADLGGGPLDVVVGGLGLGYTARAVLDHPDRLSTGHRRAGGGHRLASPRDVLDAANAACYEISGWRRLASHLHPGLSVRAGSGAVDEGRG
jgi:hypothetical protein